MHPMPEQVSGVTPIDGGALPSQPLDLNKPRRRLRTAASKVVSRKADPRNWKHALRLTGGDTSRLDPQPDGSVIIRNHAVR